jgi:hypothetical protein
MMVGEVTTTLSCTTIPPRTRSCLPFVMQLAVSRDVSFPTVRRIRRRRPAPCARARSIGRASGATITRARRKAVSNRSSHVSQAVPSSPWAIQRGLLAPVSVGRSLTLGDKHSLFSVAKRERRDDAPAIVDGLAPMLVVAVGSVPLPLFAALPPFPHIVGVRVDKSLGF